jgi:membrane-associated phospholipid phosphatase
VASGICVGAVVGHHHYIVDVAAGAAIGLFCAMAAYALIV